MQRDGWQQQQRGSGGGGGEEQEKQRSRADAGRKAIEVSSRCPPEVLPKTQKSRGNSRGDDGSACSSQRRRGALTAALRHAPGQKKEGPRDFPGKDARGDDVGWGLRRLGQEHKKNHKRIGTCFLAHAQNFAWGLIWDEVPEAELSQMDFWGSFATYLVEIYHRSRRAPSMLERLWRASYRLKRNRLRTSNE